MLSQQLITDVLHHIKEVCYVSRTTTELVLAAVAALAIRRLVWHPFKLYLLSRILPPAVNLSSLGRWAVITGATDGIGKAFAHKLASIGLDIVLISRSTEKLDAVKSELRTRYQCEVLTVKADFSRVDIYTDIGGALDGLDIAILVNNVGMTLPYGDMLDTPDILESSSQILNTNCLSMTSMSALVLPHMVSKGAGVVVNIGSCLGDVGTTWCSLYAATKSYNNMLSNCLHRTYSPRGVIIQTLVPGMIRTNLMNTMMTQKDCLTKRIITSLFCVTPESFVNSAICTLGRSHQCAGHFAFYMQDLFFLIIPVTLFDAMAP